MGDKTERICVGQLWEVITDCFLTSVQADTFNRQVKLAMGEIIEIRYPYAWHFRAEDNKYFHAMPAMITGNCKHVGNIDDKVRFNNKASLEEILRLKLYS